MLVAEKVADFLESHRRHPDLLQGRHALAVIEHAQSRSSRRTASAASRRGSRLRCRLRPSSGGGHPAAAALLGDVHARHDFQARDESLVDPLRQVHHFLSSPSSRCRMRTPFSIGSTWMSLALLLMALLTTRSTRSMIGAASLRSVSPATGSNTSSSCRRAQSCVAGRNVGARRPGTRTRGGRWDDHRQVAAGLWGPHHQRLSGYPVSIASTMSPTRRHNLLDPIAGLKLEILHEAEQQRVGHRDGEQVLLEADGHAVAFERDLLRIRMTARGSGGFSERLIYGNPSWNARAFAICFSVARFMRTSTTPRRSPVRLCSVSALRRSSP